MKKLLILSVLFSSCHQEKGCDLSISQEGHQYLICQDSLIHSKDCENIEHKSLLK